MMFIKEVFVFTSFCCFLFISRANVKSAEEEFEKQSTNLKPGFISSRFPNVSPYIKFSVTPQTLPSEIKQYLQWEKPTKAVPEELLISTILENIGISYKPKPSKKPNRTEPKAKFNYVQNPNWFGSWQHKPCTSTRLTATVTPLLTQAYQKYNQIPGAKELGNKVKLWRNAKKLIKKYRIAEFPFFLPTFILPKEFSAFKKAWADTADKFWVLKPPDEGSTEGIKVVNHWSQVANTTQTHVIQKYVQNPYIYHGNKVEFRFYTLLTSFNPLRIYISYNGIGSTKLTSNSSNKFQYQMSTSRDGFEKIFNGETKSVLKEKIEDAIIKTFLTTDYEIGTLGYKTLFNHYNAYQLFSFDFLLDDRLNVWLNKINTVPILATSNSTKTRSPSSSIIFMTEVLNVAGYHLPSFLSARAKESVYQMENNKKRSGVGEMVEDPTFQEKLYSFDKSSVEIKKEERFEAMDIQYRRGYLDSILDSLTPSDVRQLVVAEDELHRASIYGKSFKRLLPSPSMHKYFRFIQTRTYAYLLQDAWETRLSSTNRTEGRKLLFQYTSRKLHLA